MEKDVCYGISGEIHRNTKGRQVDLVNKVDGFCPQAMYSGDNITCKVAGASTRPVFLSRGLRQV